jgi:ABC-2 type transport system permease protein
MLAGRLQQAYVQALPDVALGALVRELDVRFLSLDDPQRARLAAGLGALRSGAGGEQGFSAALYERRPVIAARKGKDKSTVAYYAGAVAILFVLFSAVHGAISLLDDRDAGIIDRVLAGPAGIQVLVAARFLFLVAQSFLQIVIIFLVAWLGYGVDLPRHLVGFGLTTLAVSICAAGLALALVAACRTRRQAQNVSNVAILILSAVGGSMVPRFFMPPLMKDLGWLTPNTWGLEAYASVFWRGEGLASLVLPLALLVGTGLVALFVARLLARRWETI